jgi:hypothetical protein
MRSVQTYVIVASIIASFFLATFCFIITADAAPIAHSLSTGSDSLLNPTTTDNKIHISGSPVSDIQLNCGINDRYPQSIQQWCQLITLYADEYEMDPNLIAAVMLQESGGQHLAYSKSGAVGLMQVMPRDGIAASFICKNGPCFASRPTIEELQDPDYNVDYGTRMLASLNTRYGNIRDALKSYGPKDVGYYYADKVLSIYNHYQ